MSLLPIDLQTLFSRMNQVSRDQATIRHAEIHNQEAVGREIEQRTALRNHSVQESEEIQDGPEKVHDDDESQQDHQHRSSQHSPREDEQNEKKQLRDPDLGRNIDFIG